MKLYICLVLFMTLVFVSPLAADDVADDVADDYRVVPGSIVPLYNVPVLSENGAREFVNKYICDTVRFYGGLSPLVPFPVNHYAATFLSRNVDAGIQFLKSLGQTDSLSVSCAMSFDKGIHNVLKGGYSMMHVLSSPFFFEHTYSLAGGISIPFHGTTNSFSAGLEAEWAFGLVMIDSMELMSGMLLSGMYYFNGTFSHLVSIRIPVFVKLGFRF